MVVKGAELVVMFATQIRYYQVGIHKFFHVKFVNQENPYKEDYVNGIQFLDA